MTTNLQAVRGTRDIMPDEAERFRRINQIAFDHAKTYGFGEIMTPHFEFTDVFQRTLGDTSDIVSKEMYTFNDRGGDSITLRPEGTAGIARSFISEGLAQQTPLRFYYYGPMFRYERPQKGRYRQFHQIGVECLGVASPLADVESIALSYDILKSLGVGEKVQLELNTLGDPESRNHFREALISYFTPFQKELSTDSQSRLLKNPLRILDSKDEKDRRLIEDAPEFQKSLNASSKAFFEKVESGLQQLGISYVKNPRLVRGLDYYSHTVFEWTTAHLGAQSAVLAGGRYDGLISSMGGPATPGVGWASGVERLALLCSPPPPSEEFDKFAVIIADEEAEGQALKVSHHLRSQGFEVDLPLSGNIGKKLKRADKLNCTIAVIIGSTELNQKSLTLKFLKTGNQETLSNDAFWSRFKK